MKKDELQIYIITYNRKDYLEQTFKNIFADNSPIKNYDITIINNASTDGTEELIVEYQKQFPNLKYIKNFINIGGCANAARAYEYAATCNKKYAWVLCDDDLYDFSNWNEVEKAMDEDNDIICVADYCFLGDQANKNNKAFQIVQLTFIPACIFKTEYITDGILSMMYEAAYTVLPQLTYVLNIINNDGKIHTLSKPIVFQGVHYNIKPVDNSYLRGGNLKVLTERKQNNSWLLGFVNVITILKDKNLIKDCIEAAIRQPDIYSKWKRFYNDLKRRYLHFDKLNYFYEIYKFLRLNRKICFWIYILTPKFIKSFFRMLNNLLILIRIKSHNLCADWRK